MSEEPTKLTRQELYEFVWSEPMRTLARRFGISDVGLAKACRRHRIPRPHRGYWQQKQHGKAVRGVALPPLMPDEKDLETVTLGSGNRRQREKEEETGPVAEQKRYEKEHPIRVPEYIVRLHPRVREVQDHCRKAERSRSTYRGRRPASHAAVDVAPESLPRNTPNRLTRRRREQLAVRRRSSLPVHRKSRKRRATLSVSSPLPSWRRGSAPRRSDAGAGRTNGPSLAR